MPTGVLKPQDVLVACQLAILGDKIPTQSLLGETLRLSPSTVFESVKSLRKAKLVLSSGKDLKVDIKRLLLFLVHGVPVVFYPQKTEIVRGTATGIYSSNFRSRFASEKDVPMVWPYARGKETGEGLRPLYPSIPMACANNPALYNVMTTIDILRTGKVREREAAVSYLERLLGASIEGSTEETNER